MSELLTNMNPQQQEGIQSVDGPVLLLAGAGSGKTRVITHRIAYLIQERGVAPDSILAVTFTNKAAKEMADRVDKILGHSSLAKPMLATFHSFCVRVLRRDIEALRVNGLDRDKLVTHGEAPQRAMGEAYEWIAGIAGGEGSVFSADLFAGHQLPIESPAVHAGRGAV